MFISKDKAIEIILNSDDVFFLTHRSPDGDTLGSAFALCRAFRNIGKRAKVLCSDDIPNKYGYMFDDMEDMDFDPKTIIAVDVGDAKLLGDKLSEYAERIDLCIDHHQSHKEFAADTYLEPDSASTAEIIYRIIVGMGVEIDRKTAECLYTGLATDTGCFRFSNTTAETHKIAAELFEKGIDYSAINIKMFEEKTRSRLEMERVALNSIEFYNNGDVALIAFGNDIINGLNAGDGELEGIQGMPIQIKGVKVGVTIKEKVKGSYRVSLRTREPIDASAICAMFGGGGHSRAAGCQLSGDFDECKQKLLEAIFSILDR